MINTIEPMPYLEAIFSDLKITFSCLRDVVFKLPQSNIRSRLLFQLNEAISFESIHDFSRMKNAFLLIKTIVWQEKLSGELLDWIDDLEVCFSDISEMLSSEKLR